MPTQYPFKLNKTISILILGIIGYVGYCFAPLSRSPSKQSDNIKSIGIIIPIEHAALREIVEGFKEEVTKLSKEPIEFVVQNAQGDLNLQRSIIQQFVNQKINLIVPIGTAATQMTVANVKIQPIVSLASLPFSNMKPINLTGVLDEIGPYKPFDFIQKMMPELKKMTLIHSSSEKIFPEVQELIKYAGTKGVAVQALMIQSLPELYTISRLVDNNTDLIFILKDHMVVSGIKTIVQQAHHRLIPVVTSDEGSVKEGATFALGVRERGIGEQGGRLAVKILAKPAQELPSFEPVSTLCLFYRASIVKKGDLINKDQLKEQAKLMGYDFIELGSK